MTIVGCIVCFSDITPMIAVIKGDIVDSRKMEPPEKWLHPLKKQLSLWGESPKDWEIAWGDAFQLEIQDPSEALMRALAIKALIKSIPSSEKGQIRSPIDVRIAIGIGSRNFQGERISESYGPAFVFSGEVFETLEDTDQRIAVKSSSSEFDEEMNLYFKLASLFMDRWTLTSAEMVSIALKHPNATQTEWGDTLGIQQNSVSGRLRRAHLSEMLEVEKIYRKKVSELMK